LNLLVEVSKILSNQFENFYEFLRIVTLVNVLSSRYPYTETIFTFFSFYLHLYSSLPRSNDTAVYGYFTDRITAVISGTEIRPYHNEITARIRLYTVKIQPHIRCRITALYYMCVYIDRILLSITKTKIVSERTKDSSITDICLFLVY
jgi:hypothetical protein